MRALVCLAIALFCSYFAITIGQQHDKANQHPFLWVMWFFIAEAGIASVFFFLLILGVI